MPTQTLTQTPSTGHVCGAPTSRRGHDCQVPVAPGARRCGYHAAVPSLPPVPPGVEMVTTGSCVLGLDTRTRRHYGRLGCLTHPQPDPSFPCGQLPFPYWTDSPGGHVPSALWLSGRQIRDGMCLLAELAARTVDQRLLGEAARHWHPVVRMGALRNYGLERHLHDRLFSELLVDLEEGDGLRWPATVRRARTVLWLWRSPGVDQLERWLLGTALQHGHGSAIGVSMKLAQVPTIPGDLLEVLRQSDDAVVRSVVRRRR